MLEATGANRRLRRRRACLPGALERANRRGAHSYHPMAGRLRLMYGPHDLGGHVVALRVHHVLGRVVFGDKARGRRFRIPVAL